MKFSLIYVLIILIIIIGCGETNKSVSIQEQNKSTTTPLAQPIDEPTAKPNATEKTIEKPVENNKEKSITPKKLIPNKYSVSFSVYKNFDREMTEKEVYDSVINDCNCEGELFRVNIEGKDEEGIYILSIRRLSDTVAKGWYYIDPRTGKGIKEPG